MFQKLTFRASSGLILAWKIECNSLTEDDWACIAATIARQRWFGVVEGVPTGGLPLARALRPYLTTDIQGPLLIVDDVLTTGNSMEMQRAGRRAKGVVLFARGPCPDWVEPIWRLSSWLR